MKICRTKLDREMLRNIIDECIIITYDMVAMPRVIDGPSSLKGKSRENGSAFDESNN